jgi:hypothetical protein
MSILRPLLFALALPALLLPPGITLCLCKLFHVPVTENHCGTCGETAVEASAGCCAATDTGPGSEARVGARTDCWLEVPDSQRTATPARGEAGAREDDELASSPPLAPPPPCSRESALAAPRALTAVARFHPPPIPARSLPLRL